MTTQPAVKPDGQGRGGAGIAVWSRRAMVLLLAGAGFVSGTRGTAAQGPGPATNADTGPTIRLDYGVGEAASNSVAAFMYFVPLISPEPVTAESSPGSTQSARLTSATRKQSAKSFSTVCDFEFFGQGSQESVFDLSRQIRRHDKQLKAGGTLGRQLHSITVNGPGSGRVEVEGTVSNGVRTVTEVRLRFNARGHASPVSIELCDIRYQDGKPQYRNETLARVNTLTFCRKPGPPKMEVTVASVKKKTAGDGFFQNLQGGLKGVAVNLLIDPLTVEAIGHQAILDFGQALTIGATNFTFPRARNLRPSRT